MNGLIDLAWSERWQLAEATAAHLDLVMEALVLAVLIGVPLGILAMRSRAAERVVVGLANVLQTVPSLALLGFLLIVFRGQIGKPPARAALVVYALLPIIKNTILGLRSIPRDVAEAAVGLGMTAWQRLRIVELPLAVPIVLGGVRVATVASVGMATIAAAIGAKGLGSYIFRGVSLSDSRLILLGSIPAAVLALACDASLGEVEHALDPSRPRRSRFRTVAASAAILVLLGVAAWGWLSDRAADRARSTTVVIGSKDGSEMILLGHMLADLVEARTEFHVDRRFNLGGTLVCYNALSQGGLDAYVEYTGTALMAILKEPPQNDPEVVLKRVRTVLADRDGVATLEPFGFENTFALLMRREQAESLGIRSISDLRRHLATIRPGFGPEFMNRPDGYPGLTKAYGLDFATAPREMDRNLLYQAVAQGSIDLAAGDSTDGRIAAFNLISLQDDRRYFPPYEAVPLVRNATLRKDARLREAFDELAGQIDASTMRRLNQEVDVKRRDPAAVAREFLRSKGLLPAG
ncbi:osmoprotectant transport system permease protein [Singulisphaera sp. GP187]|uniref:ABC transporter permease/substrate-binding protein n=1 Tax=Singulisphaera sp. GP187 TaxID=1882752 RepID=UPI00092C8C2D|nr:ABC transporter permease/substrate-binding protein [Singulisphaera sp. GP187]SIO59611.1 osmoprotectant transport system permease protein [Singulisphaera sp. GP187]